MGESLQHKQLKTKARELLKEKYGFLDSEIFEEFEYTLKNSVLIIIDIVGKSSEKFVAVECGNTSKLKEICMKEELGKENIILIPYEKVVLEPHFYMKPKERKEKIKLMQSVYNKYIYEKLNNDKDFGLKEYNEENNNYFYIGKKTGVWMSFPTKINSIEGRQLQYELAFTIAYKDGEKFQIDISAETNDSVRKFLSLSHKTKEKIVEQLKKLPSGFITHDGIKYKTEKIRMPPYPRNWEINKPIFCNQMSKEKLEEVDKRLEWYLAEGGKFEEYPVLELVKIIVKKEELAKVLMILKPLYELSFDFKTKKQERVIHDNLALLKRRAKLYEEGLDNDEISEEDYYKIKNGIKEIEQENSV